MGIYTCIIHFPPTWEMSTSTTLRRTLLTTSARLSRPTAISTSRAFSAATRISRSTNTTTHILPRSTQLQTRNYAMSAPSATDGGVHNLAKKAEWDDAIKQPGLVVLDCFATWCGPCKVIAPKIVEYSKRYTDVRFYKVDVDEVPDLAQALNIRAMPTFVLFKGGELVEEVVGANPKAIEAAIEKNM